MKLLKKAGSVLAGILLWAIILLAALFTFTTLAQRDTTKVASIAGYSPMSVMTDSMAPTFMAGDLIFVKKVDASTLKEGDIVCFHTIINNEYALNTHRIHSIEENSYGRTYVTKGDNNSVEDIDRITDGDIVGKYVGKLKYFGKVMEFLTGSVGFLIVIVLPMLIFFIYQVYHLIVISMRLKKAIALEEGESQSDQAMQEAMQAKKEAMEALEEAKRIKQEAEEAFKKANASAEMTEKDEKNE